MPLIWLILIKIVGTIGLVFGAYSRAPMMIAAAIAFEVAFILAIYERVQECRRRLRAEVIAEHRGGCEVWPPHPDGGVDNIMRVVRGDFDDVDQLAAVLTHLDECPRCAENFKMCRNLRIAAGLS